MLPFLISMNLIQTQYKLCDNEYFFLLIYDKLNRTQSFSNMLLKFDISYNFKFMLQTITTYE